MKTEVELREDVNKSIKEFLVMLSQGKAQKAKEALDRTMQIKKQLYLQKIENDTPLFEK